MKYLKISCLLIGIMCFCQLGQAQNFSTEFLKKHSNKFFSVTTIGSSMIDAIKKEEKDPNILAFLNSLNYMCVISMERGGEYYCQQANEALIHYELLVSTISEGQNITIVGKGIAKNYAQEIILLVCDEETKALTMVNITGNIPIDKLSNLSSYIKKPANKNKKNH